MRRLSAIFAAAALLATASAAPAQGAFGLKDLDFSTTAEDGSALSQAGAHPFAVTTTLAFNTEFDTARGYDVPEEDTRDLRVGAIPGLIGSPEATPRCPNVVFLSVETGVDCPADTVIGTNDVVVDPNGEVEHVRVYNIAPPPGVAAKFGFEVVQVPVTIEATVEPDPPYNVLAKLTNTVQVLPVYSAELTLWGVPADDAHDAERGGPTTADPIPFITLPRSCEGPLPTVFEATSWQGSFFEETIFTHGEGGVPLGMTGCGLLDFKPTISAQPTTQAAESPTGLNTSLDVEDEGLTNPDGLAGADIREAVIALPEGMTANPSLAEGLEACTEAQLEEEQPSPGPGGCPQASKVGTVEVQTPLLSESLSGSLFIAEPFQNPFDSLLALYVVIRSPVLGVIFKQPLLVEPDPQTGQLTTIAEDIPAWPFSHLNVRLREGARSPLISPPLCGTHELQAELFPSSGAAPVLTGSTFELTVGPGGGDCPSGGTPPFRPGFAAGTLNNAAGQHSPAFLRLTRRDGDQGISRFTATLPRGLLASLVGVSQCSDAAIAAAAAKSGKEEQASPSCPASSRLGGVLGGAGAGSQLIYVPGDIYLAGPYNGAPISVVGIVPAVAGPFDVGTVVVRQALVVDPRTAEVKVDGSKSDPIPTILAGIPLRVRDIQVHVDRPNFTLNPTSCDPSEIGAQLQGDQGAFASLTARFQAAGCASLGFAPRLSLRLKGGTRRGANPALHAELRPRPGDANLERAVVRFPRSAFIDQANFRTICTRVQFAADACPQGAIYGHVKAFTPLLEEPLEGPAYLRSSDNDLPDLVFDLHNPLIDVEASARIDSVKGGIRAIFDGTPDAPLTRAVVDMQGGEKGLFVNSRNLCRSTNRATVVFDAHNGKRKRLKPAVKPSGCKQRKAKRSGRR